MKIIGRAPVAAIFDDVWRLSVQRPEDKVVENVSGHKPDDHEHAKNDVTNQSELKVLEHLRKLPSWLGLKNKQVSEALTGRRMSTTSIRHSIVFPTFV